MQIVEMESWPRKDLYTFFSAMSNPFYSVTFTQDVTNLYRYTKEHHCSFYYSLIYLCTQAINQIDAFCYGAKDGQIVRFDRREPSFTDLKPGSQQFHIVTMPCTGSIPDFCRAAKERSARQTTFIQSELESDELIYFSCLPWIEMTALTNERDFCPDDAIPRIAWGKYTQNNGRLTLNISIELNHAFTDGFHVGLFHQKLVELIDALPE